jgi:hypothetical protein
MELPCGPSAHSTGELTLGDRNRRSSSWMVVLVSATFSVAVLSACGDDVGGTNNPDELEEPVLDGFSD